MFDHKLQSPFESPPMNHFVFECNSDSYLDCMTHQVSASNTAWPLKVTQGDILFLHHYENGVLLGLWKAKTNGGRGLLPKLWLGRFPFQVIIEPAIARPQDVLCERFLQSWRSTPPLDDSRDSSMQLSAKNWRVHCSPKSPSAQIQDTWCWSLVAWDFANRELC
jgi:hypothetical protein